MEHEHEHGRSSGLQKKMIDYVTITWDMHCMLSN